MRFAIFGDVFGKVGRNALRTALPELKATHQPDAVIVNGENIAGGAGITPELAQELWDMGAQVITTGDHIWDKDAIIPLLGQSKRILRPVNYPPGSPGQGYCVVKHKVAEYAVINAMGRVFMNPSDCPFRGIDALIRGPLKECKIILVDFHCEATSEKNAMGWHLDGRVSAMVGTHTHVPTADERVLPEGTAYITDLGLTGPRDGIIGVNREGFLHRFLTGRRGKRGYEKGDGIVNGVIIDVDTETGLATSIERVNHVVPAEEMHSA